MKHLLQTAAFLCGLAVVALAAAEEALSRCAGEKS